ncbi:MAG: YqcI/YcgG family protein [Hoeflea sp.]|uniref:guanitoxin biosynthesis heme-dependent pre-guanitoxin N-hydroxylase GntA n=1 Tax=Hoeflea sp. TaxID=1940281 RepID=UPI001D46AC6C|nr:guanitoxin biosynthesis heme-dependent pre-guanitoxin N-hydroxylase GntA [Hoeflea sp.]MBU4529037.1 YqcI/YcgG family protein [Alphaproteobacteria bacterium]MBU4543442.1 YqcI/YcgG family protein [Alphaproteobacteria bacterium]MBU4549067.1 YqcI/YcgG family protein [Alphaproteobacteria bacterium]MBV1725202.1 YqcI/YcgG family protein [Hoeflea sp.]MBV1785163.1 YqcI/YcgG family protein [Hoeflea sp.]
MTDTTTSFQHFIESAEFPCVGAKSALARDALTMFPVGDIDSPASDVDIHRAIHDFSKSLDHDSPIVRSFVVIFDGPEELDEKTFEKALWSRLQSLHNLDVVSGQPWSEAVNPDPDSPHFSLSIGGEPFFVIGLHPNASRPARRFEKPALVFNSHLQFEKLRADGRFDKMKEIIRKRDTALAGDINPMLNDHGDASEARQYSGRAVDDEWKCPFAPKEVAADKDVA